MQNNSFFFQANAEKNRYRNVLPYDDYRVKLNQLPGDPFSDYINASYIDGYQLAREFIAAQGPTANTVGDFWRMIWERDISVIIMVTNCREGTDEKCAPYWSDDDVFERDDFSIVVTKTDQYAEFIVREMELTRNDGQRPRIVHQLHFTAWPDFGVPTNPIGMLKFIRKFEHLKVY